MGNAVMTNDAHMLDLLHLLNRISQNSGKATIELYLANTLPQPINYANVAKTCLETLGQDKVILRQLLSGASVEQIIAQIICLQWKELLTRDNFPNGDTILKNINFKQLESAIKDELDKKIE